MDRGILNFNENAVCWREFQLLIMMCSDNVLYDSKNPKSPTLISSKITYPHISST